MKGLLILFCVALTSCATANRVHTPGGKSGYNVNCSGSALNWGYCYEKAGQLCGEKGYEVLDKSEDHGTTLTGNQFGLYGGSVINRSMLIQRKE